MVALVFGMLLVLVLGLAVVGAVAVPARRQGRGVLTPKGEEVVTKVRERTDAVAAATRERTGDLLEATRLKAADVASHDPVEPSVETRRAS